MKQFSDRVAGIDVHRDTVVACCRVAGTRHGFKTIKRSFATTTKELAELGQRLLDAGATTVVMEAAPGTSSTSRTTTTGRPTRDTYRLQTVWGLAGALHPDGV